MKLYLLVQNQWENNILVGDNSDMCDDDHWSDSLEIGYDKYLEDSYWPEVSCEY